MSPGFFGFYAHIGALVALEAAGLLEKVGGLAHLYQVPGTDIWVYIFILFYLFTYFWQKSSSQYSTDFGVLHPWCARKHRSGAWCLSGRTGA